MGRGCVWVMEREAMVDVVEVITVGMNIYSKLNGMLGRDEVCYAKDSVYMCKGLLEYRKEVKGGADARRSSDGLYINRGGGGRPMFPNTRVIPTPAIRGLECFIRRITSFHVASRQGS